MGDHPYVTVPKKRRLLLGAGQRDPKCIIVPRILAPKRGAKHFGQKPTDFVSGDRSSLDALKTLRYCTLGQELNGSDTIPADLRKKIKGLRRPGVKTSLQPLANRPIVGKKVVEI
jgi:hypothetical protein